MAGGKACCMQSHHATCSSFCSTAALHAWILSYPVVCHRRGAQLTQTPGQGPTSGAASGSGGPTGAGGAAGGGFQACCVLLACPADGWWAAYLRWALMRASSEGTRLWEPSFLADSLRFTPPYGCTAPWTVRAELLSKQSQVHSPTRLHSISNEWTGAVEELVVRGRQMCCWCGMQAACRTVLARSGLHAAG